MQPRAAGKLCKCGVGGLWLGASALMLLYFLKIFSQVNRKAKTRASDAVYADVVSSNAAAISFRQ